MKPHSSNVKSIDEIQGYKCGKERCVCSSGNKLHCSLCDLSRLAALTPTRLQGHINAVHWNHKFCYKDLYILCCNLDCDTGSHFHCPRCNSVHSRLSRIKQHMEKCAIPPDVDVVIPHYSNDHSKTEIGAVVPSGGVGKLQAPPGEFLLTSINSGESSTAERTMNEVDINTESVVIQDSNIVTQGPNGADEGTVYIIQSEHVESLDPSVMEAIQQSQVGVIPNIDTTLNNTSDNSLNNQLNNQSNNNEATTQSDGLTYEVVDSTEVETNPENVVMYIDEAELNDGMIEKLQGGHFIVQSEENGEQVVLLTIPEEQKEESEVKQSEQSGVDVDCMDSTEPAPETDDFSNLRDELGQFYHESFLKSYADLTSMCSQQGDAFYCSLCDEEDLRFEGVDQLHSHLEKLHWNMRIDLAGFSIVSCGLPCDADGPGCSSEFHWHCPYCWMTGNFASMKSHVRSHTEASAVSITEDLNNLHRKSSKLKDRNNVKPHPPRRRGRPTIKEAMERFMREILEDVMEAVITGEKSWQENEQIQDVTDNADTIGCDDQVSEGGKDEGETMMAKPQVVPRFGDDGRELVIRTRRQQDIEKGVPPKKYKRKFEIDSDDDDALIVSDDSDDDFKVPESAKRQKMNSEDRSLEMLLLAAASTKPIGTSSDDKFENIQLAVSEDGTILLQSVNNVKNGSHSRRRAGGDHICPSCNRPFRKKQLFYQHFFNSKCLKNLDSLPKDMFEKINDALENVNSPTCPLCNKDFCDLPHTRCHYVLRTCQNTFVSKMGYQKDESTGKYHCRHCTFSTLNPRVLVAHEAREHVDKKEYECTVCHRKYAFHTLLQRHLKTTHFAPTLPKCQCDVCGKTMYTKHIKQHMRMCHDPNYVKVKEEELDHDIKCNLCDFTTRFRKILDKHQRREHGVKDKQCSSCGLTFAQQGDLTAHSRLCSVNVEERQEECVHCGKKMLKKNMKNHIELVHLNTRRFECKVCNKKFHTKYVLNCHMDTHRDPSERNHKFVCGTCGKGFDNKTMLSDHINIHTGKTPYACKFCNRQFKCGPSLHRHQELHAGNRHNCLICGSMFTTRSYWKQHMKRHSEDAALRCDCGKEYQSQSGLRNHRQTCSAVVDTEMAVEQLETSIDGAIFLWSEEDQQVLQVDAQEFSGETLVVLETVDAEGNNLTTTPVAGDDGEIVTIVQSDDQVAVETALTDDIMDQQVVLETTEGLADMDTEGLDSFVCGHCSESFTTMEDVQQHMLSHFEEIGEGDEMNLAIETTGQ